MNLTLTFPELSPPGGIETAIARFEQWMTIPNSPIRAIRHQPARPGQFGDIPESVAFALRTALQQRGITQLYTHQAEAFHLTAEGKHVVIVTPTASGKTLCYNLPVLNGLIDDPGARAMYLFPTKALAEDQLHEFQAAVDATWARSRTTAIRRRTRDAPFGSGPTWCLPTPT